MKIINKPWGKEEWLELNDRYCYKRIYINAGYKTSYQYHLKKYETNYLISGNAELWLENDMGVVEKKIIHPGDFFNVSPPKKHRIIALTDIILQEVSTPEVDDVIRIEDDTHRKDGKLDEEHKTPAVLILAAGLGTRVRELAKNKNKALIPINNKAIISYIIEKFPKEYEIIMAVGYQKDSLIEYCKISHPDRKFVFVDAPGWDDPKVGPGASALACKQYLQRPFYIQVGDTIIDQYLPYLDGNWLGISPTGLPEKYSTILTDNSLNVKAFVNKSSDGYTNAFIGIAGIRNYDIFWSELEESSKKDSEVISAWFRPEKWPNLTAKYLTWFDTGNLDDIQKTKEHFKDKPISLYKNIDETTYKVGNKFLKFSSNKEINQNRYDRGVILGDLIPSGLGKTENFIYYNWEEGQTLYEYNSLSLYTEFLDFLTNIIKTPTTVRGDFQLMLDFYAKKTDKRKNAFLNKYGESYYKNDFVINGKKYPSLQYLFDNIDFGSFILDNPLYNKFHGDLQFDNIVYNPAQRKYFYIDWRESFAGKVEGGDIYYDLSKLYGGSILPYNLLKDDNNIKLTEGISIIDYEYPINDYLVLFRDRYEKWVASLGYDTNKIKLITSLIFLNMSPLHTDKFNKLLWFKSIQGLYEFLNK